MSQRLYRDLGYMSWRSGVPGSPRSTVISFSYTGKQVYSLGKSPLAYVLLQDMGKQFFAEHPFVFLLWKLLYAKGRLMNVICCQQLSTYGMSMR